MERKGIYASLTAESIESATTEKPSNKKFFQPTPAKPLDTGGNIALKSKLNIPKPTTTSLSLLNKSNMFSPKPSFKVSTFLSNTIRSPAKSVANASVANASYASNAVNDPSSHSPFYKRRTSFGGSSAIHERSAKRRKMSPVSASVPKRHTLIRAKPYSSTSRRAITSETAKKILSSLENIAAPLNASFKPLPSFNSSVKPSLAERIQANSQPTKYQINAPPVKQVLGNNSVRFQTNKKPLDSTPEIPLETSKPSATVESSNKIETSLFASSSQSKPVENVLFTSKPSFNLGSQLFSSTPAGLPAAFTPETKQAAGGGGKIKREKESRHYVKPAEEVEITPLPISTSATPLIMKTLPTFNLGATKPGLPDITPIPKPANKVFSETPSLAINEDSKPTPFSKPTTKLFSEIPSLTTTEAPKVKPFSKPVSNVLASTPLLAAKEGSTAKSTEQSANATPQKQTDRSANDSNSFAFATPLSVADSTYRDTSGQGFMFTSPIAVSTADQLKPIAVKAPTITTEEPKPKFLETPAAPALKEVKTLNLPKPEEGSWSCTVCMITNKADSNQCVACMEPKPSLLTDTAPSKVALNGVGPVKSTVQPAVFKELKIPTKAVGEWECPTCMIQNPASKDKCVACETANPKRTKETPSVSADPPKQPVVFRELTNLSKPTDTWDCPTCMIQNPSAKDKCVACETDNPNKPKETAPVPFKETNPVVFKELKLPTKAADMWECPTCMIQNPASCSKCLACETANPNQPAGSTDAKTNAFSFGNIGNSASSGGFSFGNQSKDPTTGSGFSFGSGGSSGFSFGGGSSDFNFGSTKTANGGSGFSFGESGGNSGFSFGGGGTDFKFGSTEAAPSSFQFGSSSENDAPKTDAPSFKFGAPPITEAPKPEVSFKFGTPTENDAPKTDFKFGAPTANELSKSDFNFKFGVPTNNETPKSDFTFGAPTSSEPSKPNVTFNFGAPANNEAPKSEVSFQFNAPANNDAPKPEMNFKFGTPSASEAPKPTTNFQFGGSTAVEAPTPAVNFNFGASATKDLPKPTANFNFGGSSGSAASFLNPNAAAPGNEPLKPSFTFGALAGDVASFLKANPGLPTNDAPQSGFNFGASTEAPKPATSFNFGGSVFNADAKPTGNFMFDAPTSTAAPQTGLNFNFGASTGNTASFLSAGSSTESTNGTMFGFSTGPSSFAPQPGGLFSIGAETKKTYNSPSSNARRDRRKLKGLKR